MDQMKGAIEVESKVGGTKVIVTLSHRIAQYGNAQTLVSKAH